MDGQYLAEGVTQHGTLNIGRPSLAQTHTVNLPPPEGVLGTAQVTLTDFRPFDVSLF